MSSTHSTTQVPATHPTRPTDKFETHFETRGSLEPPKIVGRLVRILSGLWLLSAVFPMFDGLYGRLVLGGWNSPTPPGALVFYFFVAFAFWVTPHVVNIGFRRNWRHRPQWAVAGVIAVLIAVDLAVYGTWWSGPLAVFVYAWLLYVAVHLGLSLVLSGIIATPGCEMRAFPHLWTLVTGRSTHEHYCPGPLDRLDVWERRWTQPKPAAPSGERKRSDRP